MAIIVPTIAIIICFIATLCFSAPVNIVVGNLAVTLVPGTPRPTLLYKSLSLLFDAKQTWNFVDGYIVSAAPGYEKFVWDVRQKSTVTGTPVILYEKITPPPLNQQWTFDNSFKSKLASNYLVRAPPATNTVNMTYTSDLAAPFELKAPVTKPWICQSAGDPHISSFPNGRFDLFSPGSQMPGTYTLSRTGKRTDPHYLLIQADQQLCRPQVPGVYCNKRTILQSQGHIVEIDCHVVKVNGNVVSPFTGTYVVGNGVSVDYISNGRYRINFPDGNTISTCFNDGYYVNIAVTLTGGEQPSAGVCTLFSGPNTATSKKRAVLTPYQFCLSWRVRNESEDLFTYSSELAWRLANPLNFTTSNGHFTTDNTTLMNDAINLCSALSPSSSLVAQCGNYMDTPAHNYHQACLDDVIATKDYTFASAIVNTFAEKCSKYAPSNIILVLPTSGPDSIAQGPGILGEVSSQKLTYFTIYAKDVNGNPVTSGADNFVIVSEGPANLDFSKVNVGGGVYNVSYTPQIIGEYKISILLNGIDNIANSPFTVTVVSGELSYFEITGVSAQWGEYNGWAYHMLPQNNPDGTLTSPFWNSAGGWEDYVTPYWVTFDIGTSMNIFGIQYRTPGDFVHDPNEFEILYSSESSGPFVSVSPNVVFYGSYTSDIQSFYFATPVNARYWKFNILNTFTEYQAYVSYFNFITVAA